MLFLSGFLLLGLIPILGIIAAVVLIIYLIAKRIEDKDKEDFEKRDN